MRRQIFVLGAGFSRHAGMPLVLELRNAVIDWIAANKDDPKLSVHMRPLGNWPEFPNGKFRAGLERADPHGRLGFEELMIALRTDENGYPPCVQTRHILSHACAQLLWSKQRELFDLPDLPVAYRNFARFLRDSAG